MRNTNRWFCGAAVLAAAMLLAAGCAKPDAGPKGSAGGGKEQGHEHASAGPHGGALGEWGEEEYHVEFTVDHMKKEAVVYILDGTAKKAPKVDAGQISKMTLSITNVTPPLTLELKHDPQRSDAKGIAFAATHDQFGKEAGFKGNISGKVGDKDFAGDFEEKVPDPKEEKK